MIEGEDDANDLDQEYDHERDPLVPQQYKPATDPFKVANKQERLFCCGKFGTNCLIINLLQFLYLAALCSLAVEVVSFKQEL